MIAQTIRHRLAVAVQFVDAFTNRPIDIPLDVRIESLPPAAGLPPLPWRAVRIPEDATYRFLVSNHAVMPAGPIAIAADAPGEQYVNVEPLSVTLPRPLVAHPPVPARSDFLVQHRLWPARPFGLSPGETAIVGRLVSGGATPVGRVRVTIWRDGTPMPSFPFAYTNDAGEFVYRLPELKTVNGGVIAPTASLNVDLRLPPAYTTSVAPTQVTDGVGTVLGIPFSIPLRQTTTLVVSVP